VLAVVIASFEKLPDGTINHVIAIKAIAGGLGYAIFMILFGKKLLAPLGRMAERAGKITPTILGIVMMLFSLACWGMDYIGIHAVFGGFLLGTAMPRGFFAAELKKQLEPFALVFLLPMFFTFSGLNTRLDVVTNPELLLVTLVVLAASIGGKGVACWAAARLTGEDNRTSLAIGTLMNSRGLMELIIINIGLQKGIIEPTLFSMLVVMAIVTTLMASPLFELVYGRHARKEGTLGAAPTGG
jgi:Kef-type K+ transport system membrane component KefB